MHPSSRDSKVARVVVPGLLALANVLVACGPRVQGQGELPTPVTTPPARAAAAAVGREVAVGELCIDRGAGRPAVAVLAARRAAFWTADAAELAALVARGALQHFVALSTEGRRAGVFTVAGASAGDPSDRPVAAGAYAGATPDGSSCIPVLAGISHLPEDEPITITTGGACVEGDRLLVDIDGDGAAEAFPIAAFTDELNAPSEEIVGAAGAPPGCSFRFAQAGLIPSADPKAWRGVDLVLVADLDADGRHELILRYRYDGKDTWAIYSAWRTATRLELAAEAEPW